MRRQVSVPPNAAILAAIIATMIALKIAVSTRLRSSEGRHRRNSGITCIGW